MPPTWQRWTLFDPTTNETFTFASNPSEGGERSWEKNITIQSTTAPDGRTILAEGRDKPGEITWKGVVLSKAERDMFVTWFQKRTQLKRTNDYGDEDWIYITKFTPTRKHVVSRQYKAEYDVAAFVLDIPA